MKIRYILPVICLLGLSAPVMAEDLTATPLATPPQTPQPLTQAVAAPDTAAPAPMASDDLASVSAGTGVDVNIVTSQTFSNQQLSATNTGNTVIADKVTNGDISFSGDALTGYSGVGNFVMNTGNNNNLQGSVSVTIGGLPPAALPSNLP